MPKLLACVVINIVSVWLFGSGHLENKSTVYVYIGSLKNGLESEMRATGGRNKILWPFLIDDNDMLFKKVFLIG